MKKFIATAALVAASTALASAATVVFSFNADVAGATKVTATNLGNGQDAASTGLLDGSLGLGALNSGANATVELNRGKLWATGSFGASSLSDAAAALITGAGVTGDVKAINNGVHNGASATDVYTKFVITGLKGNTDYVITMLVDAQTTNASSISWSEGTLVSGSYGSTGELTTLDSSATSISLDANATAVELTLTTNDQGAVSVSLYNKTSIAVLAVSDVIPEPSAFGLLAGIGALALAVSRRKRSRR